jgi:predicted dinucleotide-binding enzyme
MRVAVIGAGQVGAALATALRRSGLEVVLGVREPDPSRPDDKSIAHAVGDAVATILATPFAAVADVMAAAGGFAGRAAVQGVQPDRVRDHAGGHGIPPKPVMFVAGDDAGAKPLVLELVDAAGSEAVDAGGPRAARLLEPLAMLWIELARLRGLGSGVAFTMQRRV